MMEQTERKESEGGRKLLWIGWDGADWDHIHPLLDQGLLPNLNRLIEEGVMGNLATMQPVLSPMLWNSAATGRLPHEHGIFGFTEPDPMTGGSRPFSSYSRKTKALWNIVSQEGLKSNVINWWASHPAEKINGCVVSNLFQGVKMTPGGPLVGKGTVHPESLAPELGRFKVYPEEIEAAQILPFIPQASKINQNEDGRLETFAKVFSETLTTHSVATAVMELEPWDFMAVYYTCIDHFGHAFMSYNPPRLPHVSEEDYEIFKDVIPGAYRFSDMMLGRMLEFCDEDTTVVLCSDHGFKSGHLRPMGQPREPSGPTIWHRDFGIVVMKGPNIKKDERIYGASLIDMTPTMLALMGLPIGRDMAGRPLMEIFESPPEPSYIDSWEEREGSFSDGVHREEEEAIPKEEAEDLINQFVALGYVDDPTGSKKDQYDSADLEAKYNCARSYLFVRRPDDALPLFEEIARRAPWENRFVLQLAGCYQKCGYTRQARRLLEATFDLEETEAIIVVVQWIELTIELEGLSSLLLEKLRDLEARIPEEGTGILNRVARIYVEQRMWDDALRVYELVVSGDPSNAFAWQSLARIYCRLERFQEAANAALDAVSLVHHLPHAHMNLGIAMARLGEFERAITAFETALKYSPGFIPVHRLMAWLYRNRLDDPEKAERHRELARKHTGGQIPAQDGQEERVDRLFDLPEFPDEAERHRILLEKRPDRTNRKKPSGKEFLLVSGLPRSGTSLMMQMLEAGGIEPKTDGERIADGDNPRGYYEWEDIKKISRLPQLMDETGLQKKAIKVISMLLQHLPFQHNYKVVFMNRPIDEVVASQRVMIDRLGTGKGQQSEEEMAKILHGHRAMILKWLQDHPRIEVLNVDYPQLVSAPDEVVPKLVDFLGAERLVDAGAMASVVDPSLKRQGKPA